MSETSKINKKIRQNNSNDLLKLNNNYKSKKRDSYNSKNNINTTNKKNKGKYKIKNIKNEDKFSNLNSSSKDFQEQSSDLKSIHKKSKYKKIKKTDINSHSNNNQNTISLLSKQNEENKNIIKTLSKRSNNNIITNTHKNTEDKASRNNKNKKNPLKSHNSIKSNGNESESSKLIIKSANRTSISNKKSEIDFKLLSHRPFKKDNKLIIRKFLQNSFADNKNTNETNSNPRNLKFTNNNKRNKHHEKISKTNTFKPTTNYPKDNDDKNIELSNGYTENGKTNINNNLRYSDDINNINKNNTNSIFKTIQKHHIKRIKNRNNNMLYIDKLRLKENMKNHEKSFGNKDYFKKLNMINLNRAKSNFFKRGNAPNYKEFQMKLNNYKNRRNNDLFFYTKHYGDHTRCPLCQSMEMKAKFSESRLGLYEPYTKSYNDDNSNLCSNHSSIKSKIFPIIKNNEEKKDNNNIVIKKELSPIILNTNNERYFHNIKEQFALNILKNKGKIEKLGIGDFPVLDKYFNS